MLHNITEEQRSHLHCRRSLQLHKSSYALHVCNTTSLMFISWNSNFTKTRYKHHLLHNNLKSYNEIFIMQWSIVKFSIWLCNNSMSYLSGMRVPFLRVGWNRQFLMMKEFGFIYDASMVAPFSDPPLWPYTMDHKIPHQCTGNNQRCPSRSYPGIWEMVMNQLAIEVWIF